jgi:hypothetical protein
MNKISPDGARTPNLQIMLQLPYQYSTLIKMNTGEKINVQLNLCLTSAHIFCKLSTLMHILTKYHTFMLHSSHTDTASTLSAGIAPKGI